MFLYGIAIRDEIVLKGKRIAVLAFFWQQALEQFKDYFLGIEKTHLLVPESTYVMNINDNIDKH